MANDENKLSKDELDALLAEVERDSRPVKKVQPQKKKSKVRIDMILAAVVALVVVIGAILLISNLVKNTPTKEQKAVAENPLEDEKYPEISDVVKNYLNAFLIEDDQKRADTIAQYVGNLYDINTVKSKAHYISGYSEIECYTKNGPYENTYVVYAYYHLGIKNIDTTVPCVDTFYVVRDTKTGNVYIQNDSGSDIQEYIKNITKDSDVQQLFKEVEKEYQSAIDSDSKLKKYFDDINAAANPTTEASTQTTQAPTTQTATQAPTTVAPTTVKNNGQQTTKNNKTTQKTNKKSKKKSSK